jgi:hypothetical protein
MYPTVNPLAAAFIGIGLPQMVIVINNRMVAISDIPKAKGENFTKASNVDSAKNHRKAVGKSGKHRGSLSWRKLRT